MRDYTPEEVNAMQAGPELDALVAERVMGWKVHPRNTAHWMRATDGFDYRVMASTCGNDRWRPSDSISDAWKVVKAVQADTRFHFHLDSIPCGGWCVRIHDERAAVRNEPQPKWWSDADGEDDVPAAVCRAALLCVARPLEAGEGEP